MKNGNEAKVKKNFVWGVATSGHQIEGGNCASDWWEWEEKGNVEGGVRSGDATDHWNRRYDDLKLAKDLGVNSYRFSVEWARVEPEEGHWDETALKWYADLVTECETLGLKPMLTLHHFTLPAWFAHQGGFTSAHACEKFLCYVRKVAEAFGARVPLWCTLNEPLVLVAGSYLGRFMPPAVHSPKLASLACHSLLKCHVLTYDYLHKFLANRREGPWAQEPLLVGYAHNMLSIKPERKYHPLEVLIAKRLNHIYNDAWIIATTGGPQRFGLTGVFKRAPIVREALGQNKTDFIGVNYYTKAYVQWWPRAKETNQVARVPIGLSFARRRDESSDLDWAVYPKGLGKILRSLKKFNLPIFITENGIADRDDRIRPRYLIEHLRQIAVAIEDGIDIRGYYHWSLLDNFEWIKGFWPRFGLYQVDYETQERSATRTAKIFRRTILEHEAEPNVQVLESLRDRENLNF
jgi:beta-glucosidase